MAESNAPLPIIQTADTTDSYYLISPMTWDQLQKNFGPHTNAEGEVQSNTFSSDNLKTIRAMMSDDRNDKVALLLYRDRTIISIITGTIIKQQQEQGLFVADRFKVFAEDIQHPEEKPVLDNVTQFVDPDNEESTVRLPINARGRIRPADVTIFVESLPPEALEMTDAISVPLGIEVEPLNIEHQKKASPEESSKIDSSKSEPIVLHPVSLEERVNPGANTGVAFDHQVEEELSRNSILFGESHFDPAIQQATTRLIPLFKEKDIEAISYELPQFIMDDISNASSAEEVAGIYIGSGTSAKEWQSLYDLTQKAKQHGLAVFGHENPETLSYHLWKKPIEQWSPDEMEKSEANHRAALTLAGLTARNEWSANYIREYIPHGKKVIIAGSTHGKLFDPDNPTKNPEHDYKGINEILGFPSIDFALIDDDNLQAMGMIHKPANREANLRVAFPSDLNKVLKDAGIGSWPPVPDTKSEEPSPPPLPYSNMATENVPAPQLPRDAQKRQPTPNFP